MSCLDEVLRSPSKATEESSRISLPEAALDPWTRIESSHSSIGPIVPRPMPPISPMRQLSCNIRQASITAGSAVETLAEHSAFPFLGEELSVHDGRNSFFIGRQEAASSFGFSRAHSLEGLSVSVSKAPCMIKMPTSRSYTELGDIYETIPPYSWLLPYIVACCPPAILSQLVSLPSLFDALKIRVHNTLGDYSIQYDPNPFTVSARPRVASDGDSIVRRGSPSLRTFYNHCSLSSRPPFAAGSPSSITAELSIRNNASSSPSLYQPQISVDIPVRKEETPSTHRPSFPPSWKSLGVVLLCREASWTPWEPKLVVLLDNYLFECTADGSTVIGFAQLSGARISKRLLTETSTRSKHACHRMGIPFASAKYTLRVSCYALSSMQPASQVSFLMTTPSMDHLDILYTALTRASKLRVEDLYEFPTTDGAVTILGKSRFTEVKLAKRNTHFSWCLDDEQCSSPSRPMDVGLSFSASPLISPKRLASPPDAEGDHDVAEGEDYDLGENPAVSESGDTSDDMLIFGDLEASERRESDASERSGRSALQRVVDEPSADIPVTLPSQPVALKLVDKASFWDRVSTGKERADAMVREVLAQVLLTNQQQEWRRAAAHSPFLTQLDACMQFPIVQIFSVFETGSGFAMELELMQSMDLFDKLAKDGPLMEDKVRSVCAQLVMAVSLCNKNGIAHRDVKLSNITFPLPSSAETDGQEPSPGETSKTLPIKLADFGMAGFLGSDRRLRGRCGTPGYVAPDILHAGVHESYNINVDLFSVGVVAYTLLCGYEPFYGDDNNELIQANKSVAFEFHSPEWDAISADAKDWIARAMRPTAERRLTPDEAKKHPWLRPYFAKSGCRTPSNRPVSAPREGLHPATQCTLC